MIDSICEIYFSPTKTTKTIINAIADGLNAKNRNVIDLTYQAFNSNKQNKISDLVIIGAPVYSGRIPSIVASRMEGMHGNGIPAIIVVLYGNREYEDALRELKDIVTRKGFKVIAAAAFIGEHSLSLKEQPIAEGRPDKFDIKKAIEYGEKIKTRVKSEIKNNEEINVPGNFPYKERKAKSVIELLTNESLCIRCNKCISVCPIEAIPKDNPLVTDGEICMRCAACIKACPKQARTIVDLLSKEIAKRLFDTCQKRKEPELYI